MITIDNVTYNLSETEVELLSLLTALSNKIKALEATINEMKLTVYPN